MSADGPLITPVGTPMSELEEEDLVEKWTEVPVKSDWIDSKRMEWLEWLAVPGGRLYRSGVLVHHPGSDPQETIINVVFAPDEVIPTETHVEMRAQNQDLRDRVKHLEKACRHWQTEAFGQEGPRKVWDERNELQGELSAVREKYLMQCASCGLMRAIHPMNPRDCGGFEESDSYVE